MIQHRKSESVSSSIAVRLLEHLRVTRSAYEYVLSEKPPKQMIFPRSSSHGLAPASHGTTRVNIQTSFRERASK
jgi:hypothetical protein